MSKEPIAQKHPLFRQYNAQDVVEVILLDANNEEVAVLPGHRSEGEIKSLAQQQGLVGPVNLTGRLANGMAIGPVQILVPSPRAQSSSLFGTSSLLGSRNGNSSVKAASNESNGGQNSPSLALDSMQRLDRIATDTVATERSRLDAERTYWQQMLDDQKEEARQREFHLQEQNTRSLEDTRKTLESKITAMQQSHERTLQEIKNMESSKYSHLTNNADEKVSLVREMSDQATRILEQTNQQTIASLKGQLDTAMSRIRDLELSRERESEAAKNRYEDYRDRMTDEVNRLREEKSKVEQSRLELMMQSQKASSQEIRSEVEKVITKYELQIRELKQALETMRDKADDLSSRVRDEATKAEIAILREQATREPLKSERLLPILNALPAEQRSTLMGRIIASDFGLEEPEDEKPSMMDSLLSGITTMMANGGLGGGAKPAAAGQPTAPPTGGLGGSEEV